MRTALPVTDGSPPYGGDRVDLDPDAEITHEPGAHPTPLGRTRLARAWDGLVELAGSVAAWTGGLLFVGILAAVLFMVFGPWAIGIVIGGALYAMSALR